MLQRYVFLGKPLNEILSQSKTEILFAEVEIFAAEFP